MTIVYAAVASRLLAANRGCTGLQDALPTAYIGAEGFRSGPGVAACSSMENKKA